MVKPSAIIEPLIEAQRAAKRISIDAIHDAALLDATASATREAKLAGLAKEAQTVEKAAADVAKDAKVIDTVDKALVKHLGGLHAMSAVFNAASPPRPSRLERFFALFPTRDRVALAMLADRLMVGTKVVTAGRLNNMAGAAREVLATVLPEVVTVVDDAMRDLRKFATGSQVFSPIDTAVHGAVQLPTRLKKGERAVKLGTDRLVGLGRIEPQPVEIVWRDGLRETIDVAGVLDVRVAIEIKGRTTAAEGIEQLKALAARGEPGYAQIGNQLWLINYQPTRVVHVLIAPEGKELIRARAAATALSESGSLTKVVAIPKELDDQVIDLARSYLEAALDTPR